MLGFGKSKESPVARTEQDLASEERSRFLSWLDRQPESRREIYLQLAMANGLQYEINTINEEEGR